MAEGIVHLGLWQGLAAYAFILLVLALARYAGIRRGKMIVLASMRMTLQLVLVGYVLIYVFDNPAPIITLLILGVMEVFAIFNIYKRTGIRQAPRLQKSLAIAMVSGTGLCMLYFLVAVLAADPWYNPQYVVPLGGMIVGNSMTALALCANRLLADLQAQRAMVEGALMLGARPKKALAPLLRAAFDASLLPTINSMVGMGIVFLPGLMTGQILSGVSPLVAISYQIIMMLSILASVALSVFIFLQLSVRAFFNENAQLSLEGEA
ncbi:ABC transporter permease [Peptococcus simiae]|uniref:ABC transporter permease n=1 Tax=Peptococcus simiae TaxID=1643805 RepID=A0ABW9GXW6_9FIRM